MNKKEKDPRVEICDSCNTMKNCTYYKGVFLCGRCKLEAEEDANDLTGAGGGFN